MIKVVEYHSDQWKELVEQGWVTESTYQVGDSRFAVMVVVKKPTPASTST